MLGGQCFKRACMSRLVQLFGAGLIGVILYLTLWPTGIDPVSWEAPADAGYTGEFEQNTRFASATFFELENLEGPEDVAIGPDGLLYTGVLGGAILKLDPKTGDYEYHGFTKGRPLGFEFDNSGNLIIADARLGLIKMDPAGQVSVLADKAEDGSFIGYADDLDILPDGTIWFSDASTKFWPWEWGGTKGASVVEIWEHAGTGRVLSYNPSTGDVKTHLTGVVFSNGVAVDPEGAFVLINETGSYRILKHWLKGDKAGTTEVLIDNLPGFPDNINRDEAGGFFMGLVSPRSAAIDMLADKPFLRNVLWRVPGFKKAAVPKPYSHLVRFDADGNILETWQDPAGGFSDVTGATRGPDGSIYVSSLHERRIAKLAP